MRRRVEYGRRDFMWPNMARKLADALGVDPEELFS
jgi:lambda repressor-like predicted transcriptional regulator